MSRAASKHPVKHPCEYAALRCVLALVNAIPLRWTEMLIGGAARLWFRLDRKRRAIARENILAASITDDAREADRIAAASFRHLAILLIEAYRGMRMSPEGRRRLVELDVPPATRELLTRPDHAVLLVSAHLGNWELAGQRLADDRPVHAVTRKMKNPYIDALIERKQLRGKVRVALKYESTGSQFIAALRGGGLLVLMADQHARVHGMPVPFLGRPASTIVSPARLHLALRVPICVVACVRTGFMRYRLTATEPLTFERTGDKRADCYRIMEAVNAQLGDYVRAYPEQYLWAHRRWKGGRESPAGEGADS